MGHHYNTATGTGKNKAEAKRDAIDTFLSMEGNRHDVRDCKALSMVKVPPKKPVTVKMNGYSSTSYQTDPTAPQNEWLEQWTFELHTHA